MTAKEIKYENLVKISQHQMHLETNNRKKDEKEVWKWDMKCHAFCYELCTRKNPN